MRILIAIFSAVSFFAAAQTPQVPHKMSFAGLSLTIRDDARREIQKDVDAMTQSPKYFEQKAARVRIYFPIIERVFREEGVPEDFKYLVIQESALIADAVSTSNAVGFWQFKDFTAIEMGLRVDRQVDERMNIAASSRAAAKYIKKNNTFFDNWLLALQAYQMGAGGVLNTLNDTRHEGAKHVEITSRTYWYVRKFLAHMIAYGNVQGPGEIYLQVQPVTGSSLRDLCDQYAVDEETLISYNKWIRNKSIPDDRDYLVLVPTKGAPPVDQSPVLVSSTETSELKKVAREQPKVVARKDSRKAVTKKINGVLAVQAEAGDDPAKLAARAGADLASFLRWNDIDYTTYVAPGSWFFLSKKRGRASEEDYHVLAKGESLWSVSQRYGVQMKKLKKFNRLESDFVRAGTTLWLSSMKPKDQEADQPKEEVVRVDQEETFTWTAETSGTAVITQKTPEIVIINDTTGNEGGPEPASEPVKAEIPTETLQLTQAAAPVDTISVAQPELVPVARKNEHVVQPKETLYAISKMYNVGVMDLVQWNQLDLQAGIKPGQILKLNDGSGQTMVQEAIIAKAPEADPVVTSNTDSPLHEVRASDTLYSIARKYGVTIKELMDWNEKKDFSLTVGEKLKVKQGQ